MKAGVLSSPLADVVTKPVPYHVATIFLFPNKQPVAEAFLYRHFPGLVLQEPTTWPASPIEDAWLFRIAGKPDSHWFYNTHDHLDRYGDDGQQA